MVFPSAAPNVVEVVAVAEEYGALCEAMFLVMARLNKLTSAADTAVSASAVLADGGDVATMRNQHGVVINLAGTSRGANILVGVQGMKITVEGAPTASTRP